MKGDGGADTILYAVNAPVGIDGGDGFDTVRVVGTEFSDDFVVTDNGVFGAGLNISYVNIEKLIADGGTAAYDATAAAVAQVKKLADTSRINAVVLLTDGEDTDSAKPAETLIRELEAQGDSSRRVRVFTIAYSAGAAGASESPFSRSDPIDHPARDVARRPHRPAVASRARNARGRRRGC